MVASKAASQSAKRKKTEDMPDSPPKRVTRARAKASSESESKTKVTKIVTASAKAAVESKRLVKPVKAPKRNSKPVDHKVEAAARTDSEEPVAKGAAKKMTRSKKSDEEAMEKILEISGGAPPTRRHAKSPTEEEVHVEAPKPRGRPKKVVTTKVANSSDAQPVTKPEPATRAVRGRAAAIAAKTNPTSSIVTAPTRKRVKFQDDSETEKENIPQPRTLKEPSLTKTGLKAKPVRKPAASRTITRSKKAQDTKKKPDHEVELEEVRPLSPKKVKQIAKSCSIGSEDELCRDRTPVRALSKSPMKPPVSAFRDMDKSASKLQFEKAEMPSSPTKSPAFTILTSPARRFPPSPFKDSLKDSPKRVNLGDSMAPVSKSLQSPTKATLLQSPAKRLASPLKLMGTGSSQGSNTDAPRNHSVAASTESTQLKPPTFSPSKAITSPLRAVRSPENPFKVLTLKPLEEEAKPVAEIPASPTAINPPDLKMSSGLLLGETSPEESTTTTEITQTLRSSPQPPKNVDEDAAGCGTTAPEIECKVSMISSPDMFKTTLPEPAVPFEAPAFFFGSTPRFSAEESDSEDELVSSSKDPRIPDTTPRPPPVTLQSKMIQGGFEWSPIPSGIPRPFSLTPLAAQLDEWVASSPEKQASTAPLERKKGIFSPFGGLSYYEAGQEPEKDISESIGNGELGSPFKPSFFEDCFFSEITADQGPSSVAHSPACETMDDKTDISENSLSQSFTEYGDENVLPVDLEGSERRPDGDNPGLTCTPATVFAPYPREIHTVSKVPLRPAGEDSPTKIPRKRSRSLTGSAPTANGAEVARTDDFGHSLAKQQASHLTDVPESTENLKNEITTPAKSVIDRTPGSFAFSNYSTPGRTVRKGLVTNILKGAVVYVDVHTSEGADASGIFLDLLTQMGARCVKQWHWNPRAGASRTTDDAPSASDSDSPGNNKIGITHVVYKDGGKRTLEKVREAKGVVLCVGVGWVLEYVHQKMIRCEMTFKLSHSDSCEREDKWLDESKYAVDTTLIPRGGHNRRKSMEPRALSNLHGNIFPAETPSQNRVVSSPTKEFLTFDTPASRRDTFIITQPPAPPQTPIQAVVPSNGTEEETPSQSCGDSPTTPYYLTRGAQLVQHTCPPKQQTHQPLFFPLSGRIEDQPDAALRQRLLAARRKTLQFVPKVGSPLGRAVSYGV